MKTKKGKINEAIEEFKQIRKNNDVGFGARVAMFFIYRKTKEIGKETFITKLNFKNVSGNIFKM